MPRRYTFGRLANDTLVEAIEISGSGGISAQVLTYGANLAALRIPTSGTTRNVVLGHSEIGPYLRSGPANGAVIGRYANRIDSGCFWLDGRQFSLDVNLAPHTIHGGSIGFSNRVWQAELDGHAVVLQLHSSDGDQGFPGNLEVEVRYEATDCGLSIAYTATTDAPTVVNLTNHAYFNLSGHDTIRDHRVTIVSDYVVEAGEDGIPTGRLTPVDGTPFDLRNGVLLGDVLDLPDQSLRKVGGFDHHFVFSRHPTDIDAPVAEARGGGLRMAVRTSEPGLQFYTGNCLKSPSSPFSGFCFETQHPPDSPNHPGFPSTVLLPGVPFRSHTEFGFAAEGSS